MKNRLGQLKQVKKPESEWTGFDHLLNFIWINGYETDIENKLTRIQNKYRRAITWDFVDVADADKWYNKAIDYLVDFVRETPKIDESIFVDLDDLKGDDDAIK